MQRTNNKPTFFSSWRGSAPDSRIKLFSSLFALAKRERQCVRPSPRAKNDPNPIDKKDQMWLFQSKREVKPESKPVVVIKSIETTSVPPPVVLTGKEFRELHPNKMAKIMRKDFTHHGYTFQNGLNVLKENFEPGKMGKGGFHFTDIPILYLNYGELCVEVEIPEDAKVVVVKSHLFKTNKIIINMESQVLIENSLLCDDTSIFEITDIENHEKIERFLKKGMLFNYYQHHFHINNFNMEDNMEEYYFLKPFFQKMFSAYPSVIMQALEYGGMFFTCIENPTTEITLHALKKYPYLISFIKNPTLEMITIYCVSCNNLQYPFIRKIIVSKENNLTTESESESKENNLTAESIQKKVS